MTPLKLSFDSDPIEITMTATETAQASSKQANAGDRVASSRLHKMAIPRRRYLDKDFYQLELQHVWRKSWLMAGHESEYPKPGSYRLLEMDLAPVVVVRGKDGRMRAFLNSCQHRGATVLRSAQGCVPVLSCQYHGWTYSLEGRLIGVPQEEYFACLNRDEHSLVGLRCEQWGGFIFINFDHNAPTLKEWLSPDFVQRYGPIFEAPLKPVWTKSVELNCNWKLVPEAFRESYHVGTIHTETAAQLVNTRTASFETFPNGHCALHTPYQSAEYLQQRQWNALPHGVDDLPRLQGTEKPPFCEGVNTPSIFPNLLVAIVQMGFPLIITWPLGVDRCRVWTAYIGVDWGGGPKPPVWDLLCAGHEKVLGEDLSNLESMQKSLAADPDKSIPLSTQECLIHQLHAEIDRLIGADNIAPPLRVPAILEDRCVFRMQEVT
jgi:choline monooxygenase